MTMADRVVRGVFTALVTPFHPNGELDEAALTRSIERQIAGGVHGLVPVGTTGETPALDDAEWERVIALTVEVARRRVPIVPGTGTNNTRQSIARTRRARELGADAALVVTPYYNKPNPEGLAAHFRAIARDGGLPLVFYNVPGRTGLNAAPEAILKIAEDPEIVAVKEASGVLAQAQTLIERRPERLSVLSGEDELTCAMTLMGGDGVISVVSNIDPQGTVRIVEAALAGDAAGARREHYRQQALIRSLFCETNPVPAKAALAILGLCGDVVRPPLARAAESTFSRLRADLARLGLS
jgi:4-hydroxy-tetrahydrodipicolinate synthase